MGASTPWPWRRPFRWDLVVLASYVGIVVMCVLTKGGILTGKEQNVFRILRASFVHLEEGTDLYAPDPARHRDIFLYSPTFAFLFAPFALLPFWLGLLLWDGLNVGLWWLAVGRLLPARSALIVRSLLFFEVLRTTQHSQSNALLTALILLAFVALEHGRQVGGALAVALGAFVKVFPLGAAGFALFHPRRLRFAVLLLVAVAVLAALPMLLVSPESWADQHASWGERLAHGASAQEGERDLPTGPGLYGGVAEQLRLAFGRGIPNLPVTLAGLLLLLAPLLRGPGAWAEPRFRRAFLASFLVFCVIFNHESESPSFVIAVTGIAIWYVTMPRTTWRTAALVAVLLVVSISGTDLVPQRFQEEFLFRYRVRTLPCIGAWLWMQWDLWRLPQIA